MRRFYVIPTAWTVNGPPKLPDGLPWPLPYLWGTKGCPGDPTRTLMFVDFGDHHGAQDTWETVPGVFTFPELWEWGTRAVPATAVTLFAPWGVLATDTVGQAAQKIRAFWPALRH